MRAIAFLRRRWLELAWGVFAAANFAVMLALPRWETIPFHFIWVSLTLLYGFRLFPAKATVVIFVGPLKAGRYPFFGDFNKDSAKGVLIAK